MVEPTVHGQPSLLVFSDDWGRHPSSCQHLVRHLLPEYRVWWVNTIGTRRPRLDRDTLCRGAEKLRSWFLRKAAAPNCPENPQIVEPKMWPWFARRHDRWLNRALLLRQLMPIVRSSQPVIGISTLPLVADLVPRLPVSHWVYYCVDDFSQWPGVDQAAILAMEERFARDADVTICVSETLQARLSRWGKTPHLLTHGVDPDLWSVGTGSESPPPLRGLERPLVLFWGLIDRRMDVEFVIRLADDMDRGTVVLLGPQASPDPVLSRLARVVCLPGVPLEQLPHYAAEAAVLVMPYADLAVTRAMQPLKLKEYLATGKPVVARDLPATRCWSDALDLAGSPQKFSAAVRRRLVEGLPESQARARLRLKDESWAEKARQFARVALQPGTEACRRV